MSETQLWRVIQSWMDGQIVRVNQSQLADALGVNRQSLSQWKAGSAPSPKHLRAIRRVTRLDWNLLTDALLTDMGYVEEEEAGHVSAPTKPAGESPAASPPTEAEHYAAQVGEPGMQAVLDDLARTLADRRGKGQPNG